MNQYKIFKHPSGAFEAVKQGWSWPGFFFSYPWAFFKRMWGLGICVVLIFLMLSFIIDTNMGGVDGNKMIALLAITANIILGLYGNSWREKNLVSRGFEKMGEVTATTPGGAVSSWVWSCTHE